MDNTPGEMVNGGGDPGGNLSSLFQQQGSLHSTSTSSMCNGVNHRANPDVDSLMSPVSSQLRHDAPEYKPKTSPAG